VNVTDFVRYDVNVMSPSGVRRVRRERDRVPVKYDVNVTDFVRYDVNVTESPSGTT
jgi:hypothetical protein